MSRQNARWSSGLYILWSGYITPQDNQDEALDAYPYNAGKSHPTIYYYFYQGESQFPMIA